MTITFSILAPKRMTVWFIAAVGIFIAMGISIGGYRTVALKYGSGSFGSCQYSSCAISLTSSGAVNLNSTPTASGVYSIQADNVTVSTKASTGYTLYITDNDTNNNLDSGSHTISSTSANQASPAILSVNTWGYRVDGTGGFGAGPTTAQSNAASSNLTFAGVPLSNEAADIIASQSTAANPGVTTQVWYGLHVDATKQAGTYTNEILYTAVTNN